MRKKQTESCILKFMVPKGHLGNRVAIILSKAGYILPNYPNGRVYRAIVDERKIKVTMARAMDIALTVVRGDADVGVSGLDFLLEFPRAELLLDLLEPVTQWVLARSGEDELEGISDLPSFYAYLRHENVTIHTRLPHFVRQYFALCPYYREICSEPPGLDLGWVVFPSSSRINIRLSSGCTEGNNFFVDCVHNGDTLRVNGCKDIHTIIERSTPWLAASSQALSDPRKRAKITELKSRLKAVIDAEAKAKREKARSRTSSVSRRKKQAG